MPDAKIISYGKDIGAGTTVIPDDQVAVNVESTDAEKYITLDTTDDASKVVLLGTHTAADNESSGMVGIREATPKAPLHIVGAGGSTGISIDPTVNYSPTLVIENSTGNSKDRCLVLLNGDGGDGSAVSFRQADTERLYISSNKDSSGPVVYSIGSLELKLGTNNTERMRISSAGKIGINEQSPATKLEITASAEHEDLLTASTSTGDIAVRIEAYDNEAGAVRICGPNASGTKNLDQHLLMGRDGSNGSVQFNIQKHDCDFNYSSSNLTNMLHIDASADKIGVNTSSPSSLVEAVGSLTTQGAGTIESISTATVTGSGTSFLTKFNPGSAIKFTNDAGSTEIRTVSSVTSDTALVLTETPGATGASRGTKTYFHDPSLFKITTGDGATALELNESSMQLQIPDGSVKRPGLRFGSSGDTGFFSPGAGRICATVDADDGQGGIVMILEGTEDTPNGKNNTAIGPDALKSNFNYSPVGSRGGFNVAIGGFAATQITTGTENMAIGRGSLWQALSTSHQNVAIGVNALYASGVKADNTAIGHKAGTLVSTGTGNVCIGHQAADAMSTNTNGVYVGKDCAASATTGVDNEIVIGSNAVGQGADTVMLGDSQIGGLHCYTTTVTSPSDSRIKTNVEDSGIGLDFINALRPVKYQKKHPSEFPEEIREERWSERTGFNVADNGAETEYIIPPDTKPDGWQSRTEYGLIAQEVKAVMDQHGPEWHGHTVLPNGMQSLGYGALTVVLVKSVQELSATIETLKTRIEDLENG